MIPESVNAFKLPCLQSKDPFNLETGEPAPKGTPIGGNIITFVKAKEKWPCCSFTGNFLPWDTPKSRNLSGVKKIISFRTLKERYTWYDSEKDVKLVGVKEMEEYLAKNPDRKEHLYTKNSKIKASEYKHNHAFVFIPEGGSLDMAQKISTERAEYLRSLGRRLKGEVITLQTLRRRKAQKRLSDVYYVIHKGQALSDAVKFSDRNALDTYLSENRRKIEKIINAGQFARQLSDEKNKSSCFLIPTGEDIRSAQKFGQNEKDTLQGKGEVLSREEYKERLSQYNLENIYYFIPEGKSRNQAEKVGYKEKVSLFKSCFPERKGSFILYKDLKEMTKNKSDKKNTEKHFAGRSKTKKTPKESHASLDYHASFAIQSARLKASSAMRNRILKKKKSLQNSTKKASTSSTLLSSSSSIPIPLAVPPVSRTLTTDAGLSTTSLASMGGRSNIQHALPLNNPYASMSQMYMVPMIMTPLGMQPLTMSPMGMQPMGMQPLTMPPMGMQPLTMPPMGMPLMGAGPLGMSPQTGMTSAPGFMPGYMSYGNLQQAALSIQTQQQAENSSIKNTPKRKP